MLVFYHNFEVISFYFLRIIENYLVNYIGQVQRSTGRIENDFLPQELMVALRQTALPSEYLGPSSGTNSNKYVRPMPPV